MTGSSKLIFALLLIFGAVLIFGVLYLVGNEGPTEETTIESNVEEGEGETPTSGGSRTRQGGSGAASGNQAKIISQIQGRVVDESGNPISGAKLVLEHGVNLLDTIQGKAETFRRKATSDSRGRFAFREIPAHENYIVSASHRDYAPARMSYIQVLSKEPVKIADIILGSGFALSGIVKDSAGYPISGAKVEVKPVLARPFMSRDGSDKKRTDLQTRATNSTGYYEFTNLSPGQVALTVGAEGFARQVLPHILLQGEEKKVSQDIVLEEGKLISGRIVDTEGQAVVGAKIEATSYSSKKHSRGSGESTAMGEFVIMDIAEGTYFLVVTAEGFSDKRENRVQAGDAGVQIILTRQGAVAGRVTAKDTGQPVTEFSLELRKPLPNRSTFSRLGKKARDYQSADGSYEYGGLDTGNQYVLLAKAPGYAPTFSQTFTISRADTLTGIEIPLTRGGAIHGVVVDAKTQKPIPGAEIKTHDNEHMNNPLTEMLGSMIPRDPLQGAARSGPDGSFVLSNLAPGNYQVEVSAAGFTSHSVKHLTVSEGSKVNVGKVSLATGGQVSGFAYDGSGNPITGGQISLRSQSKKRLFMRNTRTDATGYYVFKNVPAGNYEIQCSASGVDSGDFLRMIMEGQKSKQTISISGDGDQLTVNLTLRQ